MCPDYLIVRWEKVKVSVSRTLSRKKKVKVGALGGKGGLHNERRRKKGYQEEKKGMQKEFP